MPLQYLLWGVGGVRGECGVAVHPQDVNLNGLIKAMSAKTFHSDFPS